jgi:hypothetical protein
MQIALPTPRSTHQMPLTLGAYFLSNSDLRSVRLGRMQADRSNAVHFDANPARPAEPHKRKLHKLPTSTERTYSLAPRLQRTQRKLSTMRRWVGGFTYCICCYEPVCASAHVCKQVAPQHCQPGRGLHKNKTSSVFLYL